MIIGYLYLSSCLNDHHVKYPFIGNWQGNGVDSQGNKYVFYAKVICLGGDRYQVLILDRLDTGKKPMHVMEGELKEGAFSYTSDKGLYTGGGQLKEGLFEGYYKGPVDGTYRMWRLDEQK